MQRILILPAFNEEMHIGAVVTESLKYVDRTIVVDDCSEDGTYQSALAAGAFVLHHKANLGKAAALKTGCDAAILLGADIIALMDSDGQHKPSDLPRLLELLEKNNLDITVGSRSGGDNAPFLRTIGNRLLRFATKTLFRVNVTDIQSGFRVFRSDAYSKLRWVSNNYHADAEMTARIGIHKLSYQEIFIETIYLDRHKGMTPIDGLLLLLNILRWRVLL